MMNARARLPHLLSGHLQPVASVRRLIVIAAQDRQFGGSQSLHHLRLPFINKRSIRARLCSCWSDFTEDHLDFELYAVLNILVFGIALNPGFDVAGSRPLPYRNARDGSNPSGTARTDCHHKLPLTILGAFEHMKSETQPIERSGTSFVAILPLSSGRHSSDRLHRNQREQQRQEQSGYQACHRCSRADTSSTAIFSGSISRSEMSGSSP